MERTFSLKTDIENFQLKMQFLFLFSDMQSSGQKRVEPLQGLSLICFTVNVIKIKTL